MEDISRKDVDEICSILKNECNNNKQCIKLGKKLEKADIIPKLYVYAYIQSLYDNLKDVKGGDVSDLNDAIPKLQLYQIIYAKNKVEAVKSILHNAIDRKGKFCDFDDSKFHNKTKIGSCQNEDHDEEEENKNLTLSPMYYPDEDSAKYSDEPEWWCQTCIQGSDPDCDVSVSCDMDVDY